MRSTALKRAATASIITWTNVLNARKKTGALLGAGFLDMPTDFVGVSL